MKRARSCHAALHMRRLHFSHESLYEPTMTTWAAALTCLAGTGLPSGALLSPDAVCSGAGALCPFSAVLLSALLAAAGGSACPVVGAPSACEGCDAWVCC